jgi:hypothetical protein
VEQVPVQRCPPGGGASRRRAPLGCREPGKVAPPWRRISGETHSEGQGHLGQVALRQGAPRGIKDLRAITGRAVRLSQPVSRAESRLSWQPGSPNEAFFHGSCHGPLRRVTSGSRVPDSSGHPSPGALWLPRSRFFRAPFAECPQAPAFPILQGTLRRVPPGSRVSDHSGPPSPGSPRLPRSRPFRPLFAGFPQAPAFPTIHGPLRRGPPGSRVPDHSGPPSPGSPRLPRSRPFTAPFAGVPQAPACPTIQGPLRLGPPGSRVPDHSGPPSPGSLWLPRSRPFRAPVAGVPQAPAFPTIQGPLRLRCLSSPLYGPPGPLRRRP